MAGLLDFLSGSGGGDPSQAQGGMGLMNLYANPQLAGMLGMSQGLLSASGPSRIPVSMGQAMGAGVGGMQQGAGNALQMQRQMLQMQAMQGLMGGGGMGGQQQPQQPTQPNPTMAQGTPVTGGANVGSLSGLSAGLGGAAPQMPAQPQQAPASPGVTIMGRTPQQLWNQGLMMNMAGMQGGAEMMSEALKYDPTLAAQMPTDITKMGTQGGMTPAQIQAANAAGVNKANYIAPVNARPGAILRDPLTMQPMAFNPNIPAGGTPMFDASGNVIGINAIPGAAGVTSTMAAAKAGGEGSQLPFTTGVDAQGNPLPVMSRTQAATGNLPLALRNNNPGAVSPGGGPVAQYPTMQAGLTAMDNNLASYASDPKASTIGGAITKWVGSPPNAPAYISDVTSRLGIPANTPFDATNPAQRQALATAIMLHENGPHAVFGAGQSQGAGQAQSGAIYAAPPMGATTAANASQGAPSKQMADAYSGLSTADANYQQSRAALTEMMTLANSKGAIGSAIGVLPESVSTRVSPDAATYQKAHATFVALQGKALGSGGTDAARATLDEAVPTYDKPQSAMVTGLTNQLQNLDLNHIKTQFLTPVYQQGNEKTFTQQSAAFDNNVTPQMTPVLTMQPGPQRAQALQQMIKADPSIKPKLDWAVQNGILR